MNQPDNTRLLRLLHAYRDEKTDENYQRVVDELMNGNAYLLLPTVNRDGRKETWEKMEEDKGLKLTSVFDVDGLTVLAFKLDTYNQNTRDACNYAVQDALEGETMEQGLDLFYLQNERWYESACSIENALVYKR